MTKATKQPTLFALPAKVRAKPRVMMHVVDAGPGCDDEGPHAVVFECRKCGHNTDWVSVRTVSEGKAGWACPKCN